MTKPTTQNYLEERIYGTLGLSPEENKIKVHDPAVEFPGNPNYELPIFDLDKHGNLTILVTSIRRHLLAYDKNTRKNTPVYENYKITRLTDPKPHPRTGKINRYLIPKGQGTAPFFPPGLQATFEKGEKLPFLAFTEGSLKAFKADMHGIPMVGLGSITHMSEGKSENRQLYPEVVELIEKCQPEYLIWLHDGDCRDFRVDSFEAGEDMRKRPYSFYSSANTFLQLTQTMQPQKYWQTINTAELEATPKGMDDLLCAFPDQTAEIAEAFGDVSKPNKWFTTINITATVSPLATWLKINDPRHFYDFHNQHIGEKPFIFSGTKYKFDATNNILEILVPGEARLYFRVGDTYHKWILVPTSQNDIVKTYKPRNKTTITDDHGRAILKHIPKLEAFVNIPSHDNYQMIIENCMNVYHELDWLPEKGNYDTTLNFLHHIFGEQIELGLDYLQLLYQRPTQTLPVLCLVSPENGTGKDTMANLLKAIYKYNMSIVGNAELNEQFNSTYAEKLICAINEGLFHKKETVEKIKKLATDKHIMVRKMNTDHSEMEFFCKFIILSNNDKNFIIANKQDVRYWVRLIPKPTHDNPHLLEEMVEEIPAFLYFLSTRKMAQEKSASRMWFSPEAIFTQQLQKVIDANRPTVERELRERIIDYFETFGEDELMMPLEVIKKEFNLRQENKYIAEILRENMQVDQYHTILPNGEKKYHTKRHSYWRMEWAIENGQHEYRPVKVNANSRPFVFRAEDFLDPNQPRTDTTETFATGPVGKEVPQLELQNQDMPN
jgi:hypothetical protein